MQPSDVDNLILESKSSDLEELLRNLRKAIDTVEVGVTITDTNGKIIYTNPADARMHGYAVEELIGKHASIMGHEKLKRRMAPDEFSSAENWKRESVNIRKDGSIFPVQLVSTGVVDDEGTPIGMITICEDILQRKQAELELRRTNQKLARVITELETLIREKNDFLTIVSQDLKNPLSYVISITENILSLGSESFKPKELNQVLVDIRKSSHHMYELVTKLLDINRLESGDAVLQFDAIDLRVLVGKVINRHRDWSEAKRITLHFTPPEDEQIAYADPEATSRVLDNLISNAIKFTAPEKSIHIELLPYVNSDHLLRQGIIRGVRCQVRDEGQGLTPEDFELMFDKFAQLSAKPTGGEHSIGLGLFISKRLIEMMNGDVWAESDGKGKGTTFIFELPGVSD